MEPFSNDIDFNCYSKIGIKLKMINEQILRRTDEQLYHHLKDLHIAPQIYGIRWMRLLFIREYQFQDLLVLWDAIFSNGFGLCDYIFTAMLVVISKILLPCDYSNCLNHLMRYPSVCDVHYVIHLALHIRYPIVSCSACCLILLLITNSIIFYHTELPSPCRAFHFSSSKPKCS